MSLQPWMILVPVVVAVSSLWLIDARPLPIRIAGLCLLFGGLAGAVGVGGATAIASEREAARCASIGGVPASGQCWIDGEVVEP